MRIISGKYKARRFDVPRNFRSRPTTDFAKENLFNVINNLSDIEGASALDLFSGTGNISYELASRGCGRVISVEKDYHCFCFIRKIKESLRDNAIFPLHKDVFSFLKNCGEKFDIIFADPPYDMKYFENIPERILDRNLLNENGLFIMEHSSRYDFSKLPLFIQHRQYGSVNFSLFLNKKQA